jgi:hypothetical protein
MKDNATLLPHRGHCQRGIQVKKKHVIIFGGNHGEDDAALLPLRGHCQRGIQVKKKHVIISVLAGVMGKTMPR